MESRKHLKTELTSTLNIPPQILPKIWIEGNSSTLSKASITKTLQEKETTE
jgi:hypothetical protein